MYLTKKGYLSFLPHFGGYEYLYMNFYEVLVEIEGYAFNFL